MLEVCSGRERRWRARFDTHERLQLGAAAAVTAPPAELFNAAAGAYAAPSSAASRCDWWWSCPSRCCGCCSSWRGRGPLYGLMGNVPETTIYQRMDQYTTTRTVPGVFVLRADSPIYFTNSANMRERITWWIDDNDDDERTSAKGKTGVQYIILDRVQPSAASSGGACWTSSRRPWTGGAFK